MSKKDLIFLKNFKIQNKNNKINKNMNFINQKNFFFIGIYVCVGIIISIIYITDQTTNKICKWECQSNKCIQIGNPTFCVQKECPLKCTQDYACVNKKCILSDNPTDFYFSDKETCKSLCPFEIGKTVTYNPPDSSQNYTACVSERDKDYITINLGDKIDGSYLSGTVLIGTDDINTISLDKNDGEINCVEGDNCVGVFTGCDGNGGDRVQYFNENDCNSIIGKNKYTFGTCIEEKYDWTIGCNVDKDCPVTKNLENRQCHSFSGGTELNKTCSCKTDEDCTYLSEKSGKKEKFSCKVVKSGKKKCSSFITKEDNKM